MAVDKSAWIKACTQELNSKNVIVKMKITYKCFFKALELERGGPVVD